MHTFPLPHKKNIHEFIHTYIHAYIFQYSLIHFPPLIHFPTFVHFATFCLIVDTHLYKHTSIHLITVQTSDHPSILTAAYLVYANHCQLHMNNSFVLLTKSQNFNPSNPKTKHKAIRDNAIITSQFHLRVASSA